MINLMNTSSRHKWTQKRMSFRFQRRSAMRLRRWRYKGWSEVNWTRNFIEAWIYKTTKGIDTWHNGCIWKEHKTVESDGRTTLNGSLSKWVFCFVSWRIDRNNVQMWYLYFSKRISDDLWRGQRSRNDDYLIQWRVKRPRWPKKVKP